jgi:SM-20-related protein
MSELVQLNPELDVQVPANEFAGTGRVQIRDVLTKASAERLQSLLARETPWGLAWQAGAATPAQLIRADQLAGMAREKTAAIASQAAADADYGFAYHSYPLVTAYLERWQPGSMLERLLEELNGDAILNFMRSITGIREIVKMDGQATLYAPGHFLRPHNDEESQRGRRVAYVLNLTAGEWLPHWGGYLNFFTSDWDVEQAYRPRFNSLNLFRVPQWHSVSEISAAAPLARYAITGWARDR